ncbi:hypothetical protein COJ96_10695 [Bacillus sp. AFS073361]|uniref:hypothetical protein n=1 Tax=Bacillus sp. AFS073361 TaxID=2033511 RepID=UPI000BF76B75|nr:hypothetical protein [Bacillus sp. AFS073361]PFP29364.1 hypothetical protein COJ96_10695 [Bacillus sp. AFS073361]
MNYYQDYNKFVKMNVEKVETLGFKNGFKFDDFKKGETVYYFDSPAPAREPELKEGKVKKIVKAKNAEGKDCIRQIEVENGPNGIRSFHSHYQFANHIFKKVAEEAPAKTTLDVLVEEASAALFDGETLIVERAMSVKNPKVKELLAEGWVWVGKEWNAAKNMYLATLVRG